MLKLTDRHFDGGLGTGRQASRQSPKQTKPKHTCEPPNGCSNNGASKPPSTFVVVEASFGEPRKASFWSSVVLDDSVVLVGRWITDTWIEEHLDAHIELELIEPLKACIIRNLKAKKGTC